MLLTTIKCYLWLISRLFDRTLLVKGFVFHCSHVATFPFFGHRKHRSAFKRSDVWPIATVAWWPIRDAKSRLPKLLFFETFIWGRWTHVDIFVQRGCFNHHQVFFFVKFFTTRPKSSFSACWHGVFLRWCLHPKKSSTCCWTKLWALQTYLPSQKLKWHLKMIMSKRNLFFQGSIFRCELLVFGSVPESFQEFGDCWHMWFV